MHPRFFLIVHYPYYILSKYILYYLIPAVKRCLLLVACRLWLSFFFRDELRQHVTSSFTTPASVNSLPPFNHINSARPVACGPGNAEQRLPHPKSLSAKHLVSGMCAFLFASLYMFAWQRTNRGQRIIASETE